MPSPTQDSSILSPLFRKLSILAGRIAVWRFHRQTRRARALNEHTLRSILAANQNTEFGRQHDFATALIAPQLASAYRSAVPLSIYEDYEGAIERIKNGETNILFADPLAGIAFTSGTTGPAKHIPVTRRNQSFPMLISSLMNPAICTQYFLGGEPRRKGICLLSFAGTSEVTDAGVRLGMGSTLGMQRMERIVSHIWCSPTEVYSLDNDRAAHYLHALYGLRDRRAQFISATFGPFVLQWLIAMQQRWDELMADIEHGTLTAELALPPEVRKKLETSMSPDPARATELREAAATGFAGILPRIWPGMRYVDTIVTGSFAIHEPALRTYLGNIPLYSAFHGATETTIGLGLWPNRPGDYTLYSGASYFEFIPLEETENKNPETVSIEALQSGASYEVVVTNFAGFYRYRMGDIVTIVDYYHDAPVMHFSHRRETVLDLAGERTTEAHAQAAVERLIKSWWGDLEIRLVDYTITADISTIPPRYVFYFEPLGKVIPVWDVETLHGAAIVLDRALREASQSYNNFRDRDMVGIPQIKLVSPGSFNQLFEYLLEQSQGRNRNQLKIPRSLSNPDHLKLMEAQVVRASG
jgi:hypothetical protein